MSNTSKNPTKQRKPSFGKGGVPTPPGFEAHPERRHNGAWKKEDTARYKLEKMITMSDVELNSIIESPDSPEFEKATADIILSIRVDTDKDGNKIPAHQRLKAIEGLINQVYGQPVQKEITKESDSNDEAFIKGYLLT